MQFINATAYLNVGEEFSEHNIAVIQQIVMLQNLLKLPVFAFGDYNIDIQDMRDSGILKAHNLQCLEMPGGPSIKLGKIDYVLYTGELKHCIKHICRVTKVPHGPHFGYKITWYGNSNIVGVRIHMPYDLPFLTFEVEYENMDRESKDQKLHEATQEANDILKAQKEKTGYAILGTTPDEIKNRSKIVGEQLALNALTTEIFILKIAKKPKDQYRKYIGRSQFPLFVHDSKPPKGVPDFISKEDLASKVGILKNSITNIINTEDLDNSHKKVL